MIKECKCNPQIIIEHHGKGKFRLERQGKDYILFARVSILYISIIHMNHYSIMWLYLYNHLR